MTVDQLKDVHVAARSAAGTKGAHRFDDFVIYNEPRLIDQLKLIARGLLHKVKALGSRGAPRPRRAQSGEVNRHRDMTSDQIMGVN